MVLALVSLIWCLFVPRLQIINDQKILQELDQLEATFYTLQYRALAQGKDLTLSFDLEKNMYYYVTEQGGQHAAFLSEGLCFGVVFGTCGPPANPIDVIKHPITFKNRLKASSVMFFSNGKISSGTLYICDNNKTIGGALTCAVSQVSYIRKYVYTNKQWNLINLQ